MTRNLRKKRCVNSAARSTWATTARGASARGNAQRDFLLLGEKARPLLATLASAQCRLLFACSYIRRFKKKKKKKEFDDEDDEDDEDVVRPLLQDICKTVRCAAPPPT